MLSTDQYGQDELRFMAGGGSKAVNLTRGTYFHCLSCGPLLVGVLTHQIGRGLSG